MRKILIWLVAAALTANGFYMLFAPEQWFYSVDRISATGSFNAHFVRDIGCAYLASAAGVFYFAISRERGRAGAIVGAGFLTMHGLVHVWDVLAGRMPFDHLVKDAAGVLLLPAVIFWLVLSNAHTEKS